MRIAPQNRETLDSDAVKKLALGRLKLVHASIAKSPMIEVMGVGPKERTEHWSTFERKIRKALDPKVKDNSEEEDGEMAKLVASLHRAFKDRSFKGVDQQLENAFLGHVASTKSFSKDDYQNQRALADLRYPAEWYPATRKMQRKIILHVGPTNSGKTYHALKRLEEASTGAYAGPLRLLAHEVYTRMNAKGAPCALITGEERRRPETDDKPKLTSCTVEMVPLHVQMDVCVIDEIQMMVILSVAGPGLKLCSVSRPRNSIFVAKQELYLLFARSLPPRVIKWKSIHTSGSRPWKWIRVLSDTISEPFARETALSPFRLWRFMPCANRFKSRQERMSPSSTGVCPQRRAPSKPGSSTIPIAGSIFLWQVMPSAWG